MGFEAECWGVFETQMLCMMVGYFLLLLSICFMSGFDVRTQVQVQALAADKIWE